MKQIRVLQIIPGISIGEHSGGAELFATQIARILRKDDFETAIALVESGAVTLSPLITDTFPFRDYDKAYGKIEEEPESSMKIIIAVDR